MPPKSRSISGALIAIVVALTSAQPQASNCKTNEGTFTSTLVPPSACPSPVGICTTGALRGKFAESYDFVMATFQPAGPPAAPNEFVYTGNSVITRTKGGATLLGQDTGVMTITGTTGTFVTTVNIVGGTKQFKKAAGQYVATGELDFVTGVATGTFTSTVCK